MYLSILIYHSWYLKAQQIAPKNGRPYNQLALLAVYTVSVKLLPSYTHTHPISTAQKWLKGLTVVFLVFILIHSDIIKHVICFLVTLTERFFFSSSSHTCVLCPVQKRKLDAVYYYMRSLAASNPILTAKESLMSLFEEAKRKVWTLSFLLYI